MLINNIHLECRWMLLIMGIKIACTYSNTLSIYSSIWLIRYVQRNRSLSWLLTLVRNASHNAENIRELKVLTARTEVSLANSLKHKENQ